MKTLLTFHRLLSCAAAVSVVPISAIVAAPTIYVTSYATRSVPAYSATGGAARATPLPPASIPRKAWR